MKDGKKFVSSMDVKDKKGNILGAVCVVLSKEIGKRNIILMDEETGTQSVRSTTDSSTFFPIKCDI